MDDIIPIGLPSPARDQQDAVGQVTADTLAKRTLEFHEKGLRSRRLRDLTAEKYLLHVDGEGDSQWYDVYQGTRLAMTPMLNGVSPTQDNQLRPILDNFVAHLTTQPYRFVVEYKPDRVSRQSALVDQAIINSEVRTQKWNQVFAEAKYIAACAGFCPVHSMWRDDATEFESVGSVMPGSIDTFVGNPFDHVVNAGAKRGSLHRQTFGRSLPADLVRQAFGVDIEGSDKMPSASLFQRVVQKWASRAGLAHGHAELSTGQGHEELVAVIYDEILPGYDPMFPEGLLQIVALQGSASTMGEDRGGRSAGKPILLWQGPLPARTFSSVMTYSHHRFDDVLGKPYIGDIDDDQVELNQRLSLLKDYIRKACSPPLGGSGAIDIDTLGFEGLSFFEMANTGIGTGADLKFLEYPVSHIGPLLQEVELIYERMYRKAGWQAASRGETTGSGKAIIALQQADDSIMGPIAQRTKEELEDLAVLNWKLRKEFMDVPQVLEYVGDELAHMAEPYIDRTMMSDKSPSFRLVSGFGTSTEAKAQQLLNLLGVTDATGEPVLTARQFKKQFPDNSLYVETDDPRDVKERRPRVVNELIRQAAKRQAEQLRAQFPQWQPSMSDPFTQQLGQIVEMEVEQVEPVLIDDDLALNIEQLGVITQDPTEDPVARRAAIQRQVRYYMWLAGQQQQAAQQQAEMQAMGQKPQQNGKPSAQEAFNPAREGNTASAQGMVEADRQFSKQVRQSA